MPCIFRECFLQEGLKLIVAFQHMDLDLGSQERKQLSLNRSMFFRLFLYEIETLSGNIKQHYKKACHKRFVCLFVCLFVFLLVCFQVGEVSR